MLDAGIKGMAAQTMMMIIAYNSLTRKLQVSMFQQAMPAGNSSAETVGLTAAEAKAGSASKVAESQMQIGMQMTMLQIKMVPDSAAEKQSRMVMTVIGLLPGTAVLETGAAAGEMQTSGVIMYINGKTNLRQFQEVKKQTMRL